MIQHSDLVFERTYPVPVEKVWHALTDKDAMKQWYFDIEAFIPETGFAFSFYGKGKEGEPYFHHCKITEVVIEKKLTYSWRYDGYDGISYVTFELRAKDDSTSLTLTHKGLDTFPATANNAFAKENFTAGWTYLIGTALAKFVEG